MKNKTKFKLEDYRGRYVMHCNTESKANVFLKFLSYQGRRWLAGNSYLDENNFERYGEETAYAFNCGQFSPCKLYLEDGYEVLNFDDFIFEEKLQEKKCDIMNADDETEMKLDVVNNPKHYQLGNLPVKSFDVIMEVVKNIKNPKVACCIKDVLKYTIRAEKKNGLEDYKKAQWYLEKAIEFMESEK